MPFTLANPQKPTKLKEQTHEENGKKSCSATKGAHLR